MLREIVLFKVGSGGEMWAIPQDGTLGLWKPSSALAHLQFSGLETFLYVHLELNKITLDKLMQLNSLAACLTSPVKKSTPSAGLEVDPWFKTLDLVAVESGMADSIHWKPKIRWDGRGFQGTRGHVWTWNKLRLGLGLGSPMWRS